MSTRVDGQVAGVLPVQVAGSSTKPLPVWSVVTNCTPTLPRRPRPNSSVSMPPCT